MLELVPKDHIIFTINRLVKNKEARDAMTLLVDSDRPKLMLSLNKLEAGIEKRLTAAYTHRSTTSIHLWYLRPPILQSLKTRADEALKGHLGGKKFSAGTTVVLPPPDQATGNDRVSTITFDGYEFVVRVRLSMTQEIPVDSVDGTESVTTYKEVVVRINNTTGLIEGYSGYNNGLSAIRATLRYFYGPLTPKADRSDAWRDKWFTPFSYTETHVKAFCAFHHYAWVEVRGPDPKGEFESVEYDASEKGFDPKHARVQEQERQDNEMRRYNFDFTHQDGWKEDGGVRFTMDAHPHLTFVGKTSRTAMANTLNKFETYVRTGQLA